MGPETLRALNESVNQGQLEEMGITEGTEHTPNRSSFAFDHVTADFGPGASAAQEELRHLVAEVCLKVLRHLTAEVCAVSDTR